MNFTLVSQTQEEKELFFRAEMNYRQFESLSFKLTEADIENEIINNTYFQTRVKKSKTYSNMELTQWLKNSWNTERILFQNKEIIDHTGQSFCMQWAFPQAYYAVFGNILAMFKAIGYTETSHTAVLKKYNSLMDEGKLPSSISFLCDGIMKNLQYNNINLPTTLEGHMDLDFDRPETLDYLICKFLSATRQIKLKDKAPQMKFKTNEGKKRVKLFDKHWLLVSDSVGPTSIIDCLYRKRIKGNYQDIDVYNSPFFKGGEVLTSLMKIIHRINLVNEAYIAKAVGFEEFKSIADYHLDKVDNDFLRDRIVTINALNASW